ncbi:MAG: short-chain fatty acyl-CoA regulator family protein [Pseudomonadota bacterium]|nr:short-chain fatty acyl-CoA regulator family protein [Pseudomonadota bacterium]
MAEQKIFAGPRIRRIRNAMGLTQTAMAEELGISPSYLNLIERNQRPLTVQLLLKLSATYTLDLEELRGEGGGSLAALKEAFADPLLEGELPSPQEIVEVAEAAPNAASAIVKLHRAYRESLDRLSDLSDMLAREGHTTTLSAARMPLDELREVLEKRPNHNVAIEAAAEAMQARLADRQVLGGDLMAALKAWLKREHDIAVRLLPVHAMPLWRRRFDRHSMRLLLSERLSPFDQLREVAMEACLLEMRETVLGEIESLNLSSDEARRLARFELARYAAHALMMPYDAFHAAALRAKYDIDVLRSRFGVSFEQAVNRLTMLGRAGKPGVPFFLLEVDQAGNRFRRAGAQGFPQARFGGACPKLPIHAAFSQPGQILVERVEMPDGAEFVTVARTLEGPQAAFNERVRRTAILIGCDAGFASETVYGSAVATGGPPATPVGPACRLCERQGCLARAEPPVTRPLGLDEMVTGLSAFDFQ